MLKSIQITLKSFLTEANGITFSSRRILYVLATLMCLIAAGWCIFRRFDVQPGVLTLLQFVVVTTGASVTAGRFAEKRDPAQPAQEGT